MTPHQLSERSAEDVLVGVDVDRAGVADLVVGTSVHVNPGWSLAAEQHTLGSDVQDQQVGVVAEAQPRSAERATDGCLVPWALSRLQPLIEIAAREGRQRPGLLEPLQRVLAEDGAQAESALLAERMERGEIAEADAEAVAAMLALVGHHLAEHFFGAPIGTDRERFVQTLARMVRGDRP